MNTAVKHRPLNWANRVTLIRLLLTPFVVIGVLDRAPVWPLIVFIMAALTDVLDGALARRRNEHSTLGKILDPIADKFLLSSTFLALAHLRVLPMWVFIIVFFRDLLILTGWNVIYILTKHLTIEPRWLGKATTLVQMATVMICLWPPAAGGIPVGLWATVLLTSLSAIDYVAVGTRKLGEGTW